MVITFALHFAYLEHNFQELFSKKNHNEQLFSPSDPDWNILYAGM